MRNHNINFGTLSYIMSFGQSSYCPDEIQNEAETVSFCILDRSPRTTMVLYDTDTIARVRQTTHTVRKLNNPIVSRLYIIKRNWRLEADRKALSMFTSLGFLGAFLAGLDPV